MQRFIIRSVLYGPVILALTMLVSHAVLGTGVRLICE
jgi:hypothetical protein